MEFDWQQLHIIWNRYTNASANKRSQILTKFLQGFFIATHNSKIDVADLKLTSDVQSMCNLLARDFLIDIHECCTSSNKSDDTSHVRFYLQQSRGWLILYTLLKLGRSQNTGSLRLKSLENRDVASIAASLLRILRKEMRQYPAEEVHGDGCLEMSVDSIDQSYASLNLPKLHDNLSTSDYYPNIHAYSSGQNTPTTLFHTGPTVHPTKKHKRVRSTVNAPPPESEESDTGQKHSHETNSLKEFPDSNSGSGHSRHFKSPRRQRYPLTNLVYQTNNLSVKGHQASSNTTAITYEVTLLSEDDMSSLLTDLEDVHRCDSEEGESENAEHNCQQRTRALCGHLHDIIGITSLNLWDIMILLVQLLSDLSRYHIDLARDILPAILEMINFKDESTNQKSGSSLSITSESDAPPSLPNSDEEWIFLRHCLSTTSQVCRDLILYNSKDTGATIVYGNRTFHKLFDLVHRLQAEWFHRTEDGKLDKSESYFIVDFIAEILRASLYHQAVHFYHLYSIQTIPSTMMRVLAFWFEDGGPALVQWLINTITACPKLEDSQETTRVSILNVLGVVIMCLKLQKCSSQHREKCVRRLHRHCDFDSWLCHHDNRFFITVNYTDRKPSISAIVGGKTEPSSQKLCSIFALVRVLVRLLDGCDRAGCESMMFKIIEVLEAVETCCCMSTDDCVTSLMNSLQFPFMKKNVRSRVFRLINAIILREMNGSSVNLECANCKEVGQMRTQYVGQFLKQLVNIIIKGDARLAGMALRNLLVLIKLADDWLKCEITRLVVIPVLETIALEAQIKLKVIDNDASNTAETDRLISFGKYFLCLLPYLPCVMDFEHPKPKETYPHTLIDTFDILASITHFRRYVYKTFESFILAHGKTVSSSLPLHKRRNRLSVCGPSVQNLSKMISFLLNFVDFNQCIASAATPETSVILLDHLSHDTDIWIVYETLFVRSCSFRLRFVDANGSDAAYLLLKEVILKFGALSLDESKEKINSGLPGEASISETKISVIPFFKLFESLLVLVMEGSRIRSDYFYSGYSCEVIYDQLEKLILNEFPGDLDLARMTLNSMLNTCGRRGSSYINVQITEHIEKMLHSLSNKFENLSDEEDSLNNSTSSSEDVNHDICGYSADNDSDSGFNFSDGSRDSTVEGDAPAEMPVHPGLLRLTCRVTMSLAPETFHEVQQQILTSLLPIIQTTSAARFTLPEMAMLPSIMEKQKKILVTTQKEFKDLRLSALNLTRVIAMNRLSVVHLKTLLEVIRGETDCVVELLQVLIDVAASMQLAPLWTMEFPLSVCSEVTTKYLSAPPTSGTASESRGCSEHSRDASGEDSIGMACVRHALPDVAPGFWCQSEKPAASGFTVSLWIMLESKSVMKTCSIIPDKNKKSKSAGKSGGNHLLSHFRTMSGSGIPTGSASFKYRSSSTRAGSNDSISQETLLTTEQVLHNFLHVFSLDSCKPKSPSKDSDLNGNSYSPYVRFQMWCEPMSGSIYFRLYSSQSEIAENSSMKMSESTAYKINQQPVFSKTRTTRSTSNSSMAFGSSSTSSSSFVPKSRLVPVAEAGLKSILSFKQWTHLCISVVPDSSESSSVNIFLNGVENYEMTLLHPPLLGIARSTPVLSVGHQCIKDFTSVNRIYQIGNIAVFKESIQSPESPLYIYSLGPDWVSQPLGPAGGLEKGTANNASLAPQHLESIQYLLDRLMSHYTRNERFINIIQNVAQQLTEKKGWVKMLHIRRAMLATYSMKDPFQMIVFPTNLATQTVPQPSESSGFFSSFVKRVASSSNSSSTVENGMTALAASSSHDVQTPTSINVFPISQWAESQPVQMLDKGLAKLTPYNRKTLDESLIPLGGLKVLLYLLAKIGGVDKTGDLQEKALDLLLTTIRQSLTLRQELFDLGGYKLISKVICSTNFVLSDTIVALLVNSTGSRPLLQLCPDGLNCSSKCNVLCMDVHLIRSLLLTWPFWKRINLNQGCSLLDALLLYVAEENAWQEVNARKFQEWEILDALLFSCQQLLQEDNKLPSEKFCQRLVSLMDACVGSPPNIDQLTTLCEALLLMHPPANTFITFEEKTFSRRMKPFLEEPIQRQQSNSIFYIGAQRSDSISSQGDQIERGFDGLNLISGETSSHTDDSGSESDINPLTNQFSESTVTLQSNSKPTNQNALTQSLMSDVESQVLKKFYDLTSKPDPMDSVDIEEEMDSSTELEQQSAAGEELAASVTESNKCEDSIDTSSRERSPPMMTVSSNKEDLVPSGHSRQSSSNHALYGNFSVHTSDNDPGAVALTCGLLRLLTDILKVKLPDNMVPQVVGRTLKPELLLTLAMHPSILVREGVLETYFAYLNLAYQFSDVLVFPDLDLCLLLSNQIHQFPASQKLIEVAFSIVIGQPLVFNLSAEPFRLPPSDTYLTAGDSTFLQSSSGAFKVMRGSNEHLSNNIGWQISYNKSFLILISLLERTVEDLELCRQTIMWLNWVLQGSDTLIHAALDSGLCESLLNFIYQLNSVHSAICPQDDTRYWQVLTSIEQLVSYLTQWMFFSTDPKHFVLCVDFIRLLHALEDTEAKRNGCNSCCTEFCQHVVCHSLQSVLDQVADFADRPITDYLTNEKSLKGRRNTSDLIVLNMKPSFTSSLIHEETHSRSNSTASVRSRNSKSLLNHSSSQGELTMKDLISRFPRMICMMIDFIGYSRKLFGPLTKEKHLKEMFKKSTLEFLIRASVHLATLGSTNKKNSWGIFLWGNREVIRTLSARMLVYMTLPITELATRCFVINALLAETGLNQMLKFIFASQNVAVYQFYNNLEDFCAMLYTDQISAAPPDCLSGVSIILSGLRSQKLVKEHGTSRSVTDLIESGFSNHSIPFIEEETVWARKETLRRQQWEQRIADTISTWKNRCSTNSTAITDQAIKLTKIIVNTQNAVRKRFIEAIKKMHADSISVKKQWRQIVHHLTHERAVWYDPSSYPHHWEIDPTEGASRVRKRLRRCYLDVGTQFFKSDTPHRNASCCLGAFNSLFYLFHEDENSTDMDATLQQLHVNDKISLTMRCSWVSMCQSLLGELLIGQTAVYFVGDSTSRDVLSENKCCYNDSSTFTWPFEEIRDIHTRRYELRDTAMEIFLINGLNYLLAMDSTKDRDIVYSKIKSLPLSNLVPTPTLQQLQQSWLLGNLTNFDYLTHLNTLAGRSYNDLMQYPIFPFVLRDYSSSVLDLCRVDVYRNLAKPLAVQNSDALVKQKYTEKLQCYEESRMNSGDMYSAIPPFHYASHYSNSAMVLHYLIRLPPFTQKFITFQDNNFDVPDRSFHTLSSCYTLSTTSISSVKELIPEFFYLPEFLDNFEEFDMGTRQNGELVDHVKLPKWCNSDPRLFNLIHRAALESSYVTEHLCGWIDLIFGFKQVGKPALDALNLFHPYTYFGAINPDDIEDPLRRRAVEDMIRNYGQTPKQLFARRSHQNRRVTYPLPGSPGGPLNSSPGLLSVSASGLPTGFGPEAATRQQKEVRVFPTVYGLVWGPWVGSPSEPDVVLTWRQEFPLAMCWLSPLPIISANNNSGLLISQQLSLGSVRDDSVITTTGSPCDYAMLGCEAFARLMHISHPGTGQRISIKLALNHTENSIMAVVLELRGNTSNSLINPTLSNYCSGPIPLVRLDPRWKVTCLVLANRKRRIYLGLESGQIVVVSFRISFVEKQFPLLVDNQPASLYAHCHPVTCLTICESFRLLASGDTQGNAVLWDTNKLRYIRQIVWPSSVAPSSSDCHKTIPTVREAAVNQSIPQLGEVLLMTFSETLGDLAIVRRIKQGRSWLSVFTLNARHVASQNIDARIHSMVYSNLAEGQNVNVLVLGLSHGRLRFMDSWKLANVNRLQIEQKEKSPIIALCFAPGARRLYASSEDGCVYLLESREGTGKQNMHSEHFIPCIEW